MKKNWPIIAAVLVIIALSAALYIKATRIDNNDVPESLIAVKTTIAEIRTIEANAQYVGVVKGEAFTKLSFLVPGRIQELLVGKDEQVREQTPLARIEPDRLSLGASAASSQIALMRSQVGKAQEAFDYAEQQVVDLTALFTTGGVSQQDIDSAQLRLEMAKLDLNSASQQLKLAQTQGGESQLNLDDAVLMAPYDGYIVDWLAEEGEITGSGIPVALFSTEEQVIEIGVTQEDYVAFEAGKTVDVEVDGKSYPGVILSRAAYPTEATRTYVVEVQVSGDAFPLGALGTVKAVKSIQEGILIPVTALIYSDGVEVYTVVSGQAKLVKVEIVALMDDLVLIKGLDSGTQIITEGIKRVQDGDPVRVIE